MNKSILFRLLLIRCYCSFDCFCVTLLLFEYILIHPSVSAQLFVENRRVMSLEGGHKNQKGLLQKVENSLVIHACGFSLFFGGTVFLFLLMAG